MQQNKKRGDKMEKITIDYNDYIGAKVENYDITNKKDENNRQKNKKK